jgi:hypothetical protein
MNQHSQNSIQAVVFDYGGVLCHPPATSDIDRLALTFGLPRDKFWRMYGRLRGPYDRGAIGAGEYWRTMAQCAGVLLTEPELKAIYKYIGFVLKKAIGAHGDSMQDFRTLSGEFGNYQNQHKAYQLTGEKCQKRDGGIIERIKINGRSAHYCPIHQK